MSKPLKFLGVRRLLMSKPLKRIHQVLPCMDDLSHQVLPCMDELRYFCICILNHELCDSRSSLALTQHSPRSHQVLPWMNHELCDSRSSLALTQHSQRSHQVLPCMAATLGQALP